MSRTAAGQPTRRATNITLPVDVLAEARALDLNVSQACEQGLKAEIAKSRAARVAGREPRSNDYVERHGLPLAEFRQF